MASQRGILSDQPTPVRFYEGDAPLLRDLAMAKGFNGLSALIRHATYVYADREIPNLNGAAAGPGAGPAGTEGGRLIWSFADVETAERLEKQVRRIGTLLNQAVRALNIIAAAIDEGGDPGDLLRRQLPHADDMRRMHGQVNKLTADLGGFVSDLKSRVPDRKDGRRRDARPRSAEE